MADDSDNEKHAPFTASPLDAWRGANRPATEEPKPKPKPKKPRKAKSVPRPAIRREGPVRIEFK